MRASIALLLGVATLYASQSARAQDMEFGLDEETPPAEGQPAEGQPVEGEPVEGEPGSDFMGDLASQPSEDANAQRDSAPRATETAEEIYAVQRIYALRINRVELAPSIAFSVNDPYVGRTSPAVALNYWFTNVLSVGVSFQLFQGLENESDLNFFVRRSTRLAVPITEFQLGAHLNFTYVPLYGKFAMFNNYIFQWDAYVVGGVGLMRTRPVPVIDPEIREFDFDWRVAFNVGIGIRVFVTRWLAIFGELRDYAYLERLENLNVALGDRRTNTSTWLDESPSLTNNVMVHLGLTVFLPFSFDYRLPR